MSPTAPKITPLPAPVAGKVGHNLPSPSVIFPYIMHSDLDVRRIQETELENGVLDMKWQKNQLNFELTIIYVSKITKFFYLLNTKKR